MGNIVTSTFNALWIIIDTLFSKIRVKFLPRLEDVVGDVAGQTIIVTGPTSGIGLGTTGQLVRKGAIVVLAVRNVAKGEALKRSLIAEAEAQGRPKPNIQIEELEVSSLASVRAFAHRWNASSRDLDVLINNAGIDDVASKTPVLTSEGHERHLATNYLGPSLLTRLLLPSLLRTGGGTGRTPRVVHVSSVLHFVGNFRERDPNYAEAGAYDHATAYSDSKLLQVLFSWELHRRSRGKVLSIAVHPGLVATDIARDATGAAKTIIGFLHRTIALPREQGSRSSLYAGTNAGALAFAPIEKEPIYLDWDARRQSASARARDPALAVAVWAWTAAQTDVPADLDAPLADAR